MLPTATFAAPSSVVVGQAFTLTLTDAQVPGHPEATTFTYAFDCGDGQGYGAASDAASATCPTTAAGTRTVRGRVIDQDGDAQEYTATVTVSKAAQEIWFNLGSTPPNPAYVGGGYTVIATGGGSGNPVVISSLTPGVCTVSGNTVSFVAVGTCTVAADQAGNDSYEAASQQIQTFPVVAQPDATAPVITPSVEGTLGQNGWYTSNVAVSFSVSDPESAVSSQQGCDATTVSSDTEGVTFTCSATSAGGTSQESVTLKRDATAPTLAPTVSPNPVVLGGSATASANASDALSGLASASCGAVSTSRVGEQSVSCTATDRAGNTATVTAAYRVVYAWAGFFSPVDNLPVVNKAKAGSAIPVKFSLGGDQGLNIFAAGSPSSQALSCTSGAPTDVIDETVTAGSSGLSYDAATGQYTYVWKTQKNWANTCRQLTVKLTDGTEHQASFQFTK